MSDNGNGTLTRWAVGVVTTAIVAALGYLVVADRAAVGAQLNSNATWVRDADVTIRLHEYRLQKLEESQRVIDAKLDAILERLPEKGRR